MVFLFELYEKYTAGLFMREKPKKLKIMVVKTGIFANVKKLNQWNF